VYGKFRSSYKKDSFLNKKIVRTKDAKIMNNADVPGTKRHVLNFMRFKRSIVGPSMAFKQTHAGARSILYSDSLRLRRCNDKALLAATHRYYDQTF